MPGARDRWGQLADPGAPGREVTNVDFPYTAEQPERGSIADLRRRMERLPPGHPSSPYNDDMTRKPPVARLKDLELPLHGTEPGSNGAATRSEPGVAEDGLAAAAARAASAGSNGSGGQARMASILGATERLPTRDRLGTANGTYGTGHEPHPPEDEPYSPAGDPYETAGDPYETAGDPYETAGDPYGTAGEPYETAGDPYGTAGEPDDVAGDLDGDEADGSAEGPHGAPDWLSTSTWADTGLDGTADGDGLADGEGTAGWNTTTWDESPGWDAAPELDGTGSNGAVPGWSEPEPGVDTLTHAVIDAGQHQAAGDDPATGPDGSWEWNGRYLTPEESRMAEEALGRCRVAEGRNVFGSYGHSGLTPAMRRIEAQLEHGQLLPDTESRALKPADSFKEKLADMILRHPDKSAEELALEVHDGIRYTLIFEPEHYADGTLQAHSRLKGNGFDLEVRRNCWQSQEYKGINSRWRDPAHDLVFDVQFHTAASWGVSQRARSVYEAITDPATPPQERERLRSIYTAMSASVPVPPGSTAIPDYRKEG